MKLVNSCVAVLALICTYGCGSSEETGVTTGETTAAEATKQVSSAEQEAFKQKAAGFNPKNAPK